METKTTREADERPEGAPTLAIYVGASRSAFWSVVLLTWLLLSLVTLILGVMALEKIGDGLAAIERAIR